MKLVDLKTQHPGGWQDIIDHCGGRKVSLRYVSYGVEKKFVGTKSELSITPSITLDMASLEELDGPCSGDLASSAYRILMSFDMPVPGDKLWTKPCSEWGKT